MEACWLLTDTCDSRQCKRYGCLAQRLSDEHPVIIDRPRMVPTVVHTSGPPFTATTYAPDTDRPRMACAKCDAPGFVRCSHD